jgi:hypothetical protein
MLGVEESDFYNTDLTFHLTSMPRDCSSLDATVGTAHATSRFECGFATTKFIPFLRTVLSESRRTCFERLRTNSESGSEVDCVFPVGYSADRTSGYESFFAFETCQMNYPQQ